MGPRPSDRGRPNGGAPNCAASSSLQWVHGLLTVGDEHFEAGPEMDVEELASMGPRPSDRGRLALLPPRLNPVLRFNGSTAF